MKFLISMLTFEVGVDVFNELKYNYLLSIQQYYLNNINIVYYYCIIGIFLLLGILTASVALLVLRSNGEKPAARLTDPCCIVNSPIIILPASMFRQEDSIVVPKVVPSVVRPIRIPSVASSSSPSSVKGPDVPVVVPINEPPIKMSVLEQKRIARHWAKELYGMKFPKKHL